MNNYTLMEHSATTHLLHKGKVKIHHTDAVANTT